MSAVSFLRLSVHLRLLLVLVITGACLNIAPQAADAASTLVKNGSFDKNLSGWESNKSSTLSSSSSNHGGGKSASLKMKKNGNAVLDDTPNSVSSTTKGTGYALSAWVRTSTPNVSGQLRVRQVGAKGVEVFGTSFWLTNTSWTKVDLALTTTQDRASLDVSVVGWTMKTKQKLYIDSISMRQTAAPVTTVPQPPVPPVSSNPEMAAKYAMSNGTGLTARGVPLKGALFGATYGSNNNPAPFEQQTGQRLGVRRTFWAANQVDAAVATARQDLNAGRLPWISFKLPYGWPNMATGKGDAWAKGIAQKLATLPGPVWIAFHHEPEGDGDMKDWVAIQERLSPIVRSTAPNVAYTVIYTGYYQLYGPEKYQLANVWPKTKIDVVGFDVYNQYGMMKNGTMVKSATPMRTAYFEKFEKFAASKGVAWGLAETAISDPAAKDHPTMLRDTYDDLVATHGVAMAYFNTHLHSKSSWAILDEDKIQQFGAVLKSSPEFPKLV